MLTSRSPIESPENLRDGDHLVQFYKEDSFLTETVTNYVAPALMNGEGVIIIATEKHLSMFEQSLRQLPLNTSLLRLTGQLVMLEAQTTLDKFMINGLPDAQKFAEVAGEVLYDMKSKFHHVKAYGEMVNILWNEGNIYGTVALEKLWNALLSKKEFSLLCAYSMDSIAEEKEGIGFSEVCQCHTHVIPAEGVIDVDTPDQQMRQVAFLQFKQSSELKTLNEWKASTLEMKIPLTALKIHLRDIKSQSDNDDVSSLISKCELQISRLNKIVEQLSK